MKSNIIHENAVIGKNLEIGHYNVIQDGVVIGNNVKIGSHTIIKSGTVLEDDVFFDSSCISSGQCVVGAGSQIRYQSIIARHVIIHQNVFFCAGVKTAYLDHGRKGSVIPIEIHDNAFLGDNVTVLSSIRILEGVVVGAHSLVNRHCDVPYSVYFGYPAKYRRNLSEAERKQARGGY